MAIGDDIGPFFAITDFAKTVTHVEGAATFPGIFDEAGLNLEFGEASLETSSPKLMCKATDVAAVSLDDTVTVDGVNYYVAEKSKVDDGLVIELRLHRQ